MDRRHFLDEQRRNRRKSRRFSVFAVFAVALSGIPLCVIASPLIFSIVLLGAHAWDVASPLSAEQWASLRRTAFVLPEFWSALRGRSAEVPWRSLALLLLAPGALVMLAAWPFVRRLQRSAGAGTILRRLPSREIEPSAIREQQLANVVHEMAVAAGVPVPRVRIVESNAANIVAIGLTTDDVTILASTGFLEALNRDERQAMVAHLVGSVGNGDLEIAAVILSVIETWGLLTTIFESVVYPKRRRLVRRFVRASARSLRRGITREEASSVVDPLLGGAMPDPMEVAEAFNPSGCMGVIYGVFILVPLLATVGLASIAARHASALFTVIGFGPWLAAMWRARRRLADATAVELTRNPTALAAAVQKLGDADVVIPGGWPVSFLFPVWAPITEQNAGAAEGGGMIVGMRLETEPRLAHLEVLGAAIEREQPGNRALSKRIRNALPDWKELRGFLLWGTAGLAMCALLLSVSLILATGLLAVLWWVLAWIFSPLRALRRIG